VEIFKLFGSIFVDSKDADQSIQKTGEKAETTGSKLGKLVGGAAKVGSAVSGAMVAAGAGVMGLATKTSEATDRIDKMSQQLGMSRKGFQEWDYILSQNGASIDSFGAGMKTLNKSMMDVKNGAEGGINKFLALDDSLIALIESGASQEEVMAATIASFQNMPEGIEKSRLAVELFGKQGQELLPMLNQTQESTEALAQQARDLGMVMSDETVDAGVVFGDTLDALKKSLGAVLTQGMGPMLPAITALMNELIKILPSLLEFIAPLIEKLTPVLGVIIEKLLPVFMKLLDALMPILDPLIDLFLIMVDSIFLPLIDLLTPLIDALLPVLIDLFTMLTPVLIPLIASFMQILNMILPPLLALFGEASKKVLPMLGKAFEALKPIIDAAMTVISAIITTVMAVISGDWKGAWQGIKETFSGLIGTIKAIAGGFKDAFVAIFNAIKSKITGIWDGMVSGIMNGINKLQTAIDKVLGVWDKTKAKISGGVNAAGAAIQSGTQSVKNFFGLASGGTITQSGGVLVGENGPELLNLPKGASVIPLDRQSSEIVFARGAFEGAMIMDDYGVDKLMDRMRMRLSTSGARL